MADISFISSPLFMPPVNLLEAATSAWVQFHLRASVLLIMCLFVLQRLKSSAANRHLLVLLTLFGTAMLPLSASWLPAIDIPVESPVSIMITEATRDGSSASSTTVTVTGTKSDASFWSNYYPYAYLFFVLAYFGVAAVLLIKVFWSNGKILLLNTLCKNLEQREWRIALLHARVKLRVGRRVQIRHSRWIDAPFTWGLLKPIIFVPSEARHWSEQLIKSTLMHEVGHIRRHDWLFLQLSRVGCAVCWFNPLYWRAYTHLSNDAEAASDDLAMHTGIANTTYAEDLLKVARSAFSKQNTEHVEAGAVLAMAPAERHNSELRQRIQAVLDLGRQHRPLSPVAACLISAVTLCLFLPLASIRTNYIEPDQGRLEVQSVSNRVLAGPRDRELLGENRQLKNEFNESSTVQLRLGRGEDGLANELGPPEKMDLPLFASTHYNLKVSRVSAVEIMVADQALKKRALADAFPELSLKKPLGVSRVRKAVPNARANIAAAVDVNDANDVNKAVTRELSEKASAVVFSAEIEMPATTVVSPVVRTPMVKRLAIPKYPFVARSKGIEGEVTVAYDIDHKGNVLEVEIVSAQPRRVFNRSVIRALKKSVFSPAKVNGQSVGEKGLTETFIFVLES